MRFFFSHTGFHDYFEDESHCGLHEILTSLCLLANVLAFHDIYRARESLVHGEHQCVCADEK